MRRVGIFGWGIVAPRSPNVDAFARNLDNCESWLSPFDGFGPSNFLVGNPEFSFREYKPWIDARFPPSRFHQLESKMGQPTLFAIGAFIQSLEQNPGLEEELHALGTRAHIYVGCGLGDYPTSHDTSITLYRAQRRWDRFWAEPQRNRTLREFLKLPAEERAAISGAPPPPPDPDCGEDREKTEEMEEAWNAYWTARSAELADYLAELRAIDSISVEGEVEAGKAAVIRRKHSLSRALQKKWEAPDPPWARVSANVLWNIHNTPSSQISMLGRIHGMTFAPVAACSTFGYALKLGMSAIQSGEADAVVIGATDPAPHPLTVGSFVQARVVSADGEVSKPLTGLRGTHVSGGSAIWILGELEHMRGKGFQPLGMEPLAVGVTADAHHIITPSAEGPTLAIEQALAGSGIPAEEITSWDLHATATPGDYLEVETLRRVIPEGVVMTARKGSFGHGMSVGGGWELTAQHIGHARGSLHPTPLEESELNPEIARLHGHHVYTEAFPVPPGPAGKLSMGVGGINACVISRPWE